MFAKCCPTLSVVVDWYSRLIDRNSPCLTFCPDRIITGPRGIFTLDTSPVYLNGRGRIADNAMMKVCCHSTRYYATAAAFQARAYAIIDLMQRKSTWCFAFINLVDIDHFKLTGEFKHTLIDSLTLSLAED